jgi:hypothetical protein
MTLIVDRKTKIGKPEDGHILDSHRDVARDAIAGLLLQQNFTATQDPELARWLTAGELSMVQAKVGIGQSLDVFSTAAQPGFVQQKGRIVDYPRAIDQIGDATVAGHDHALLPNHEGAGRFREFLV